MVCFWCQKHTIWIPVSTFKSAQAPHNVEHISFPRSLFTELRAETEVWRSTMSLLHIIDSQVRRFPQVGTSPVTKIQKKSIEKSYLDPLYHDDSKNLRNRSSMLELLSRAPKNTFELHLSSEIH